MPTLRGREQELEGLERALDAAWSGTGAVALIEGPAGIGKTALLAPLRERAAARGATILSARASELDRAFGFGVVHQLLEPVLTAADPTRRARLLDGAAARAERVLLDVDAADDLGYAALHGLYWLVANLAAEGPLLVLVDDLQWADASSLRFLEYLGRRADGLPLLVAGTLRPNEPDAPATLLAELAAGPAATVIRPASLTGEDVAALLADVLGAERAAALGDAALHATGGNPLLVGVLAREAAAAGDDAALDGERLAELGARGVAPAIARRLRPLGEAAVATARAAAVVGERGAPGDVAALAGCDDAHAQLDRLVAAGILQPGGRAFVHPLVRAAVLEACPPGARSRLHAQAAERLRGRGAPLAEVVLHHLATAPSGDAARVADLRRAAAEAAASGAPEAAVEHLRRALAEPPEAADRAAVLVELGELEVRTERPEGPPRLHEALALGLEGDLAARAHVALGNHLVHRDAASALAELEQGLAEAVDPDLRLRLEAFTLESVIFADTFAPEREARFAQLREAADPSIAALAHLACDEACRGRPVAEVRDLATRAFAGGALVDRIGPASSTWNLAAHSFRFAEDADRAAAALTEGEQAARRRGLHAASFFVAQAWAYWHRDFGSVATGAARSRLGLEAIRELGLTMTIPALVAAAAENLVHLDQVEEAAALFDDVAMDAATDTFIEPFALTARGLVRHLQLRHDDAEADLRRTVALGDARGWALPTALNGRLRLADLLAARGEHDEARALAERELAAARAAQARGAEGKALRMLARATPGEEAVATLREAVAVLAQTPFALERGWALHDLGTRLRLRGDRRDARPPLREALDLASRAGATLLARRAGAELESSGGRLTRERLSGIEALTPAERRVAELAAEGLSNREIAETLWVTVKTVEVHLGRSYAKLDIASRRQLAGALAA